MTALRAEAAPEAEEAAACLTGSLEGLRPLLASPCDPRAGESCAALLQDEILAAKLELFARRFPGGPAAASASVWSQSYLACLILPLCAAALILRRSAEAPPGETRMILDAEASPLALRPPARLCAAPAEPCEGAAALSPLLTGHVRALVEAVSAQARLSPRVIWGSAAHGLEWLIRLLESERRISESSARSAMALLEAPCWPEGGRNPLLGAIHYVGSPADPEARRRKVCCLRLQLAGVVGCGALCPKRESCRKGSRAA